MDRHSLYERVPVDASSVRILAFHSFPEDFVLHWHEQTELLYIQKGVLHMRCGESLLSAKEGDCVIINGNELHEGIGGKCEFLCLYLPPTFLEEQYYIFKQVVQSEALGRLFSAIYEESLHLSSDEVRGGELALKGYVNLLLAFLVRNCTEKTLTEGRYRQHTAKAARINDAIKYLKEHPFSAVSTATLARLSYMSEGHFCRLFKEVTSKTVKEYACELRLQKAVDLLLGTNLTVAEIAEHCGFSSANYFARLFKKVKGISPKALRNQ